MPKLSFRFVLRLVIGVVLLATLFLFVIGNRLITAAKLSWSEVWSATTKVIDQNQTHTFLVLGIGGSGHEGPNLTDTILLASYKPQTHTLTTLGLPRDIWDTDTQDKINATYTYALAQKVVDPYTYTKMKFERITGVSIDQVIVIDFGTFAKAIDIMGGVTVVNDVAFTDPLYPLAGAENRDCVPFDIQYKCRYESVSFPHGSMQMDGATALKFVRSRHAVGDEGTDFARSHRQQLVITGIKQKLITLLSSLQISRVVDLVSYADAHVARTMSNADALLLVTDMVKHRSSLTMSHKKIPDDSLIVPPAVDFEDRYVLIPKDKKDSSLAEVIQTLLD